MEFSASGRASGAHAYQVSEDLRLQGRGQRGVHLGPRVAAPRGMRPRLPLILLGLALGVSVGCGSVTSTNDGGGTGGSATGEGGTGGTGGHGGATGSGGGSGGHAGRSGGKGGGGGAGGASCDALATQYADALPAAQSCDLKTSGECQQLVSSSLSPCFLNCTTYVNDPTALNAIKASWEQAGCNSLVGIACPAIACLQPTNNVCSVGDSGGGVCSSTSGGIGGLGGHGGATGGGGGSVGSAGAGGGPGGHGGGSGGKGGTSGAGGGSECSPACDPATLCCSEPSRTVTDAGVVVGSHWVCVAPTSAGACPLQP
jgi:hypothetical protein